MQQNLSRLAVLTALGLALTLQLHAEQTGTGRRFLAADDSTRRLAIIAPDGSFEWELKIGGIHDAQVLPNGNVLLQQGFIVAHERRGVESPVVPDQRDDAFRL